VRAIDDTHSSFPDLFPYPVVTKRLADHRRPLRAASPAGGLHPAHRILTRESTFRVTPMAQVDLCCRSRNLESRKVPILGVSRGEPKV